MIFLEVHIITFFKVQTYKKKFYGFPKQSNKNIRINLFRQQQQNTPLKVAICLCRFLRTQYGTRNTKIKFIILRSFYSRAEEKKQKHCSRNLNVGA